MLAPLGPLARGRAAAAALMLDTCEITRPTGGPGPIDPETGERTPAPTETVYPLPGTVGRCKLQTYEPHESTRESADHVYTEQRYHLHLPMGSPQVRVGDTATITASKANPHLVGRSYRIAGEHEKSLSTAHRLPVDEVVD